MEQDTSNKMPKMKQKSTAVKTHNVVLYNDPMHSLEYVVKVLTKTLPNVDERKAVSFGYLIHNKEKAVIYSGMLEHCEHYVDMIERHEPEEKEGFLLPSLAVEVRKNIKKKN